MVRLFQYLDRGGRRRVGLSDARGSRAVEGVDSVYALALEAIGGGADLADLALDRAVGDPLDLDRLESGGALLVPLDHPDDPAHMLITGTGLSHLGSAEGRDAMHRKLADDAELSDSMKMFKLGIEGGKPAPGETGVQPEWFYKGDGAIVVPPGQPLPSPGFARDGGEEPEIVGLYVIGEGGTPWRVGFALGNEFSDHVTERENYLYLAHSKLRPCAFGPELLLGPLPRHVEGVARIRREGMVAWEKPFLSGEDNMCHAIDNLERHHFKYAQFRRPGDVHAHFFGTATLSFSDGFRTEDGDVFEIEAAGFGHPLRNALGRAEAPIRSVGVL